MEYLYIQSFLDSLIFIKFKTRHNGLAIIQKSGCADSHSLCLVRIGIEIESLTKILASFT